MTLRIGLLIVGHVDGKSVHIAGDYPDLFATLLRKHDLDLVRYDLDEGHFPGSVRECDGWLCSPSRCSTYDEIPWIADAEQLLRDVLGAERPYVGICFGHQLLAQALGAPVERFDGGWQVGVQDYEIVDRRPWMDPGRDRISLIASHEDQVVAVPDGAELLARSVSGSCAVAGLAVGELAWSLQPHPEFVPEMADHLLAGRVELIGEAKVEAARASLYRPLDRAVVASWIARFFEANAARSWLLNPP